jgi:hypothetical protein
MPRLVTGAPVAQAPSPVKLIGAKTQPKAAVPHES